MDAKNTDRELWRERADDYYTPSIHVTQDGAIGINVGGSVIVQSLADWHAAARRVEGLEAENAELAKQIREWVDHTADGVPMPLCEQLYCPRCASEVRIGPDWASCDHCVNPDDGCWPHHPPLPLFQASCYSSAVAARAALKPESEEGR